MLWSKVPNRFMSRDCTTEEAEISWIYIVLWQTLEKEYKTINVTYALPSKEFIEFSG